MNASIYMHLKPAGNCGPGFRPGSGTITAIARIPRYAVARQTKYMTRVRCRHWCRGTPRHQRRQRTRVKRHEDQSGKAYPSRGTVLPTGTTSELAKGRSSVMRWKQVEAGCGGTGALSPDSL